MMEPSISRERAMLTRASYRRAVSVEEGLRVAVARFAAMPNPIPRKEVLKVVCLSFGYGRRSLLAHDRRKTIVQVRHLGMAIARRFTRLSFPQIGDLFARDHTTVIHGVWKAAPAVDAALREVMQ